MPNLTKVPTLDYKEQVQQLLKELIKNIVTFLLDLNINIYDPISNVAEK